MSAALLSLYPVEKLYSQRRTSFPSFPLHNRLRVVRLRDQKVCTLTHADRWDDEEEVPYFGTYGRALINEFDVSADRPNQGQGGAEAEVEGDPFRLPSKMLEILFDVR